MARSPDGDASILLVKVGRSPAIVGPGSHRPQPRRRLTVSTVALKDVTKVWPDGTMAVNHVSLDVKDGEFLVLLGPSGCGKSTILRMIAGLEDPSEGDILLNGDPVLELAPRDRSIAMVFQDFALYPHMTVNDNIGFPLRLSGMEANNRLERVGDVASALGIGD